MSTDINGICGSNLRRLLAARGYTVSDMAAKMGVTTAAATAWAEGKSAPRLARIPELCAWLDCGVEDLLTTYEAHNDGSVSVRGSQEEIIVVMAYRQANETRKEIVRDILHVQLAGRTDRGGKNT